MTLEVQDIVAGYTKEVPILRGVNLTAGEGMVTVIIGPNGAGKSTLLKTIYGYLPPRQGEILHDGKSLKGLQPKDMLREGIAFLLQGHSVFPRMTVHENLELGAWTLRGDKQAVSQAFDEVYTRYPRLKEKRHLAAGVLSGGEQRMLEIARLTMTGPKTLLLDEPSVGLMPKLVDSVYDEIMKLKEQHFTILIVDQNVKKSIQIADYVYVLSLGENSHHGPQAEFEQRLEEIIKEWL
ncbi:MAG: ABC transporter ATP-binding protein [Gammaproteobacteria bacterium]|nr:ABC transporter ATP-binding protein [Gammaproteobacteria bacterium]NIR84899.1 ABC transporter ATP-binding protein [Gammaproteobacteria bacterium]NIR91748.1 ABC transporter ATP-binding protein [Gammaproteobacteria bacterium]NIU05946.1 ABC transporter ATP-binding protein [Gammaproteobacteria bacterium]NIV52993.1 ATP-binding cassette domain-containing protein [Gammaproteobacteria bacterium]